MEIINIVTLSLSSVDTIRSFVIADQSKKKEIVAQAEKEFEKVAREIGYDDDDHPNFETILEDGYFHSHNKSVCINWSDKVKP